MKKNNKVLINFYEIDEYGHIFYVYGDESSTAVERGAVIAYEIDEKKLGAITTPRFAREMLSGKRHFGFFNVDRTTIVIVGRNRVEFGYGFNTMCDITFDAFAFTNIDRWYEGDVVTF